MQGKKIPKQEAAYAVSCFLQEGTYGRAHGPRPYAPHDGLP